VARTGIIAALDVTTNKLAWRYQWPEQCYSGTLATAAAAVRRPQRRPADRARLGHGKQLWEFQTGAGMHAPVSTFEHKGKQYVLAYSAGAALLGSARGDSVWLFGLEGKMGPVQPARLSHDTAAAAHASAGSAAGCLSGRPAHGPPTSRKASASSRPTARCAMATTARVDTQAARRSTR
jgi:hypothetical protein